ncbi:NAD+ synthase [Pyrobaculum aerophilum]|uniref:NH(3)-dependent NAD(+) synthetase n=1 Tax=Pyrobaculum aerophilum TaxID=13773 RepID=A0A371QXZ6_9CREN|nr:NAD+ synthase [Pyrobaculum aerophilum]RFA94469.1 NAD(+) synthetase [Pyrobaculum aerophilum]RFA95486.1 NAD(+) synthetase [Pyrobaculum aerophilum]
MFVYDVVNALDYEKARSIITAFISQYVQRAGSRGVVVGISGGVDSTVAAALAVEALGRQRVLGLLMPSLYTPPEDLKDALDVINALGVEWKRVDITPIYDAFVKTLPDFSQENRVAAGNILPRIRMTVLYYYANKYNLLVMGTGDRSELLLGYLTKYGDGGVDFLPIGSLFKLQVRELAARLGFADIAKKPSSPRLWQGHTAEGELGASYEVIDQVLYAVFDLKKPPEEVKGFFGEVVDIVITRVKKNIHKLTPPAYPDITPARRNV